MTSRHRARHKRSAARRIHQPRCSTPWRTRSQLRRQFRWRRSTTLRSQRRAVELRKQDGHRPRMSVAHRLLAPRSSMPFSHRLASSPTSTIRYDLRPCHSRTSARRTHRLYNSHNRPLHWPKSTTHRLSNRNRLLISQRSTTHPSRNRRRTSPLVAYHPSLRHHRHQHLPKSTIHHWNNRLLPSQRSTIHPSHNRL